MADAPRTSLGHTSRRINEPAASSIGIDRHHRDPGGDQHRLWVQLMGDYHLRTYGVVHKLLLTREHPIAGTNRSYPSMGFHYAQHALSTSLIVSTRNRQQLRHGFHRLGPTLRDVSHRTSVRVWKASDRAQGTP